MSNVLINGRTAVHAGSGGILNTVDVCLTKVGPAVVPIPYANIAQSEDASATAGSVFIDGHPVCTAASIFAASAGDEAGSDGGVKSGITEGAAEFISSSADVFIEGEAAVRMGDMMISNDGNTAPAPLMQGGAAMPSDIQAQATNDTETITAALFDHASTHATQGIAMMQNSHAVAAENDTE
ncbi:DUF4150 domain-containing protein [Aliidiomarina soli]|uniref:Uncharacterized protein n=1 Tax=Aliidiomarina soli TaxID=1928574 RepID=A0A432WIV4_9GAMM|nr:DUF4150 domain-containing protein [Aliidiomarina soli]RUO33734.1 hypothetical protein CWE14_04520 [Aliidiomarina soli]